MKKVLTGLLLAGMVALGGLAMSGAASAATAVEHGGGDGNEWVITPDTWEW
ncbi:hypothetical protein [Amycolatopsis magusensis]|uniref:Uncharacterized protein n=1 Tax=Amycolatopsis magusensis TaxID=882444 RepID=A0ABS4PYL1_9PSEU|nr:hypothetical protein [Amycolatopsis magusensis]MBP2183924.1 hypothetical protein [Amycolatopsis magusensis]MDI5977950.1 hypothetical protein [Amycolatopsis magusensis]